MSRIIIIVRPQNPLSRRDSLFTPEQPSKSSHSGTPIATLESSPIKARKILNSPNSFRRGSKSKNLTATKVTVERPRTGSTGNVLGLDGQFGQHGSAAVPSLKSRRTSVPANLASGGDWTNLRSDSFDLKRSQDKSILANLPLSDKIKHQRSSQNLSLQNGSGSTPRNSIDPNYQIGQGAEGVRRYSVGMSPDGRSAGVKMEESPKLVQGKRPKKKRGLFRNVKSFFH